MWLEAWAWVWLPPVGGLAFWLVRSHLALRREVRALRRQVERMESELRTAYGQHRVA
ncbi:MAG: hypothetical protein AB1671_08985 [Thermodesulfobacteriota bacterium]|jgi:hypothetical protein